jgi:hypothetical protein
MCLRRVGTPETGDREDSQPFRFTPVGIRVDRTFRKDVPDLLFIHIKKTPSLLSPDDGWASFQVIGNALLPDQLPHGDTSFASPYISRSLLIIRLKFGRVSTPKVKSPSAVQ